MKEPAWSLLAAFKSSGNGQAGSFMSAPFNILAHLYVRPSLFAFHVALPASIIPFLDQSVSKLPRACPLLRTVGCKLVAG